MLVVGFHVGLWDWVVGKNDSLKGRAVEGKRTQIQFAALIGISPRTLQNREQGHRRPEGTARALLRVAESHPQADQGLGSGLGSVLQVFNSV